MNNKIRFNRCTTKKIGSVRYTVRSFFDTDNGDCDFQELYENIVVNRYLKSMEHFKERQWGQLQNGVYYAGYAASAALHCGEVTFIGIRQLPAMNALSNNLPYDNLYPATIPYSSGPDRPRVQWRR